MCSAERLQMHVSLQSVMSAGRSSKRAGSRHFRNSRLVLRIAFTDDRPSNGRVAKRAIRCTQRCHPPLSRPWSPTKPCVSLQVPSMAMQQVLLQPHPGHHQVSGHRCNSRPLDAVHHRRAARVRVHPFKVCIRRCEDRPLRGK